MEPLVVDVREAARLTSLSPHTIRNYVKKVTFPQYVAVGAF
jgi:predicted DNA-binding transcriptional regulator AlpA